MATVTFSASSHGPGQMRHTGPLDAVLAVADASNPSLASLTAWTVAGLTQASDGAGTWTLNSGNASGQGVDWSLFEAAAMDRDGYRFRNGFVSSVGVQGGRLSSELSSLTTVEFVISEWFDHRLGGVLSYEWRFTE